MQRSGPQVQTADAEVVESGACAACVATRGKHFRRSEVAEGSCFLIDMEAPCNNHHARLQGPVGQSNMPIQSPDQRQKVILSKTEDVLDH